MGAPGGLLIPRGKLSTKVAKALEGRIVRGEFPPGGMLPTEAELCEQFQVSRTVIREAVRSLEARGLVHIRHGIGTQVTAGGKNAYTAALLLMLRRSGCTAQQVFDFRKLVEPEFAASAAQRATARDLAEMEAALDDYAAAHRADDATMLDAAHRRFHQAILQAVHNPVVEAMIEPLTELILLSSIPRTADVVPRLYSKELQDLDAHREIYACIKAGDSLGARRAMLTDFDNARTDYDLSIAIGSRDEDTDGEDEN